MIPILFPADATTFETHGLGDLVECTECKAKFTDEGEYELALKYPMTGELFSELENSKIVVAKVNDYDQYQAFRIYNFEKSLDGTVQVSCQHISYDLSGIPVKPFMNITRAADAMSALRTYAVTSDSNIVQDSRITCPFNFSTDIPNATKPNTDDQKFKIEEPMSIRAALLDGDDSIKGSFGGDLVFDNFNVYLKKQGGQKRNVVLEYGVDIMDLSVENNISEMFTDVVGYWKGKVTSTAADDTFVFSSLRGRGTTADDNKTYLKRNATVVDLSEFFPNPDLITNGQIDNTKVNALRGQLDAKTDEWIVAEHIGEPEINVTVSYAKLGQDVHMYDEITVRFPKMGIDVTAKVCSYSYDVLNEMCTEVEVGNAKSSAAWKGLEDASRLKRGLIPPKRIADHSITSQHLGYSSVGPAQIEPASIDEDSLADTIINKIQDSFGNSAISKALDAVREAGVAFTKATGAETNYTNLISALTTSSTYSMFKENMLKDTT